MLARRSSNSMTLCRGQKYTTAWTGKETNAAATCVSSPTPLSEGNTAALAAAGPGNTVARQTSACFGRPLAADPANEMRCRQPQRVLTAHATVLGSLTIPAPVGGYNRRLWAGRAGSGSCSKRLTKGMCVSLCRCADGAQRRDLHKVEQPCPPTPPLTFCFPAGENPGDWCGCRSWLSHLD